MIRRALTASLLLLLPAWAAAQTADPATRELIEKLLTRIDGLEKRVAELEKEKAPGAPGATIVPATAPPTTTAAETKPAQMEPMSPHSHHQVPVPPMGAPEQVQPTYPFLKIAGFGDVDFSATNLHGANGGFGAQTLLNPHSGFELGQTTLHLTSALSPEGLLLRRDHLHRPQRRRDWIAARHRLQH